MTKLYCELTLVNRSNLTLHVAGQSNIHGSFDGNWRQLVDPGQVARYTAKDPDGAAAGSEGTITFIDSAGTTFTLGYCCSWAADKNYAGIMSASPLLDVTLRFGNDVPPLDAGKSWGSATFPTDGHPLGILIYVEQKAVVNSLKVLSYNTHLFKGSNAAVVKPSSVQQDEARSKELLKRILAENIDIVCLQEVWSLDFQEQLTRDFMQAYPYIYLAPDNVVESSWWDDLLSWLLPIVALPLNFIPIIGQGLYWTMCAAWVANFIAVGKGYDSLSEWLRNALSNTSGLFFASKHPLKDCSFTMYTGMKDDERFGKKGLISCTVTLAGENNTPVEIKMGLTHCPTDTDDGLNVLKTVCIPKVLADRTQNRILLGDFNLHMVHNGTTTKNDKEYGGLCTAMAEYDAHDIVDTYLPNLDDCYTDWQTGNSLTWLIDSHADDGKTPTSAKNRIDYIFPAASNTRQLIIKDSGVTIAHNWDIDFSFDAFGKHFDTLSVSDHYPVLATFNVVPQLTEPYKHFRFQNPTGQSLSDSQDGNYLYAMDAGITRTGYADLFTLKRQHCGTQRLEVHVLGASDGYASWIQHTGTALGQNDTASATHLIGDYHNRNVRDLYYIKKGGSKVEVHILDGANNYGSFLLQIGTPINQDEWDSFDFQLGNYHGDGRPDLFCFKRSGTGTGFLEVHVLSGVSNYQNFVLQKATTVPCSVLADGKYILLTGRYQRTQGNSDLFLLNTGDAFSRHLEVSVLDGATFFQNLIIVNEVTPIPIADVGNFTFAVSTCNDHITIAPLYCIKTKNTGSSMVEVHVLS